MKRGRGRPKKAATAREGPVEGLADNHEAAPPALPPAPVPVTIAVGPPLPASAGITAAALPSTLDVEAKAMNALPLHT
jgi:hypothetical protein